MKDPKINGMRRLTDEQVESVAAGYILDQGEDAGVYRYMIISDVAGFTLDWFPTLEGAQEEIDRRNSNRPGSDPGYIIHKTVITRDQYKEIFGRDWGWDTY